MTERATKTLLSFGLAGSALAALYCAGILTPLLIGLLAALGLGALTGTLDALLLPALAACAAISGAAAWHLRRLRARQLPTGDATTPRTVRS